MTGPTPSDPQPVSGPGSDRRWVIVPLVLLAFLLVALVKPWSGDPPSAGPSASVAVIVPSSAPSVSVTASPVLTQLHTLPAAAEVVASKVVPAAPWANELAADPGGAWAWSDPGLVVHVAVATDTGTLIDLGTPTDVVVPLGARGIAVAGSQVWASDAGHRGLARIDRETRSVAERIALWSADQAAAARQPGVTLDRWASAWGFAIEGDSIFVPSIMPRPGDVAGPGPASGELWRVDPTSGGPPSWISIDKPTGVAVGFGSVWVVSCCGAHSDARTYSIVRLEEETGGVQASMSLPVPEAEADGRPVVRVGPNSVWVGLADIPLVVRIDPATNSIRSTLPMDLPVSDLAIGDDGSVWVTESEAWYRFGAAVTDRCTGYLVRLDPATERLVGATTMTCPMSVAISGRDVWVGSAGIEPSATGGAPPAVVHLRAVDPPG